VFEGGVLAKIADDAISNLEARQRMGSFPGWAVVK
jgi:hypothetical protein